MDMTQKVVKTKEIFDGRVVKLRVDTVQLPDGRLAEREIMKHPGGVGVIAIDEDKNVLMVRQFRDAAKRIMLEIPAGKLEYGENPLECGKRELVEETGFRAAKFEHLGEFFVTPAYCEERINIYLASELTKECQNLDDGEFVEVEKISLDTLFDMVMHNEIADAKTIIAVLKAKQLLSD